MDWRKDLHEQYLEMVSKPNLNYQDWERLRRHFLAILNEHPDTLCKDLTVPDFSEPTDFNERWMIVVSFLSITEREVAKYDKNSV